VHQIERYAIGLVRIKTQVPLESRKQGTVLSHISDSVVKTGTDVHVGQHMLALFTTNGRVKLQRRYAGGHHAINVQELLRRLPDASYHYLLFPCCESNVEAEQYHGNDVLNNGTAVSYCC